MTKVIFGMTMSLDGFINDANVGVGQQLLKAGLVDELVIGIMPIFLGEGSYKSLGFEVYGVEHNALKFNGQYFDEDFMVLKD